MNRRALTILAILTTPCWLALVLGPDLCAQGLRSHPAGVDDEIEASVKRGLDYLVWAQDRRSGAFRGTGYGSYPTAMTALAGMALLGSGSTPTRGRYWRAVRGAAGFLMDQTQPDGLITAVGEESITMHGHGFATMFLAQVYGMEEEPRTQRKLHRILTKAVALIHRAQSAAGGWNYTPDSRSDEGSVTVTQIQALRACRNVGISVSKRVIDRAVGYIRRSAGADGGIAYSLRSRGAGRPAISAAAVAVLYNAGRYDDPVAEKALAFAVRNLPINGSGNRHHYYSQLYLSQALYQKGDRRWDEYYRKMTKFLLRAQRKDGSWQGDDAGTVYGTAIALTIMQLPYALVPIYQR